MAQFAGGLLRMSVRKRNGDRIKSTKAVDYSVYDNTATPRVVINEPGTVQDQAEPFPTLIHGSVGEYLTVDFFHTAAVTTASSASIVTILYEAYFRSPVTGQLETDQRELRIGDRITKSTASTQNDPRGINDNKVTVANEWTPILAFAPARQGENCLLKGYQYILVDGA
jgi:hypothetical protein